MCIFLRASQYLYTIQFAVLLLEIITSMGEAIQNTSRLAYRTETYLLNPLFFWREIPVAAAEVFETLSNRFSYRVLSIVESAPQVIQ